MKYFRSLKDDSYEFGFDKNLKRQLPCMDNDHSVIPWWLLRLESAEKCPVFSYFGDMLLKGLFAWVFDNYRDH